MAAATSVISSPDAQSNPPLRERDAAEAEGGHDYADGADREKEAVPQGGDAPALPGDGSGHVELAKYHPTNLLGGREVRPAGSGHGPGVFLKLIGSC